MEIWDKQLAKYGRFLIETRKEFIDELNEIVGDIHKNISGGKENLVVKYEPSVEPEEFEQKLTETLDRDLYQKNTGIGPHRDELSFFVKDENLKLYGSQGQQRTAALSVKMAEIELVRKKVGENPILLLDDVLSELDRGRQQSLLNSINGIQTIITCTGLEEFVGYRSRMNTLYKVTSGSIEKL